MVLNTHFNNISVISWRTVLWVEEAECTEKTINLPQVNYNLYHIMYVELSTPRHERDSNSQL
jgi:hypothetical protein